ncbi:MAG: phosphotransferase [Planctomycetia bacterium]
MTTAAAIAAWLPRARWYAAKDGAAARVSIHDAARIPGTTVALALVDVAADGVDTRYAVPMDGDADAALSPEFAGWVVQAVLDGTVTAADHGLFRGHPVAAPVHEASAVRATTTVAPLGGDASNTSLLVTSGRRQFAVKLLRRCRAGIQPEVEVGEFLSRDGGWTGTPRLHGWLDYAPTSGEPIAIATVHAFALGCTSAWDHLGSLMTAGGLAGSRREAIIGVAVVLGRLTAEMHRVLASRADLPAFAPVMPTAADMQGEAGRMADHASVVFGRAAARLDTLPTDIATSVRAVLSKRDEIVTSLRGIGAIHAAAAMIRVHGDYHLGQVLIREPGPEALVIDFEGEPSRPLAERRRKTSVFKDVAGMCRSFDYALRHAARTGAAPYQPADLRLLEATFLDAYRAVARGHAWWPDDERTADALLAVYTLDKAVYELAYELANRPEWVEVPLAALVSRQAT